MPQNKYFSKTMFLKICGRQNIVNLHCLHETIKLHEPEKMCSKVNVVGTKQNEQYKNNFFCIHKLSTFAYKKLFCIDSHLA